MVCQMFSFFLVFRRILSGAVEMERCDVTRHKSIRLQGKNQPRRQSQPQIQRQHIPPPLPFCSCFTLYFTFSFLLSPFSFRLPALQQLQQQSPVPLLPKPLKTRPIPAISRGRENSGKRKNSAFRLSYSRHPSAAGMWE
jgi:hypothetical protein